jgi:heat-inducible transcriptional repressor
VSIVKPIPIKKFGKRDREKKVLLGLTDYYIRTGKPVGSNSLKEAEFEDLSSATIRNYFANLEEQGYLSQSHSSGGRIPTNAAYRTYAQTYVDFRDTVETEAFFAKPFRAIQEFESREMASLLQESADVLAEATQCAVFLSAPRFDQDFVVDIKLVALDARRCLCVLITDFGVVKTEVLQTMSKLSSFGIKRMESYFNWRLKGLNKPNDLKGEEELLAQSFYNELMVRYIVGYTNFINEEIHRTGFSRLLSHADFQDGNLLASSLALFENAHAMRLLLRECTTLNRLKFWIGEDLLNYTGATASCAVLAIPYYINRTVVGAVGILGPSRIPYRELFSYLHAFSKSVSETLTRNVYKYQVTYRQPKSSLLQLPQEEHHMIGQSQLMMLEDKRI